MTRTRAPKVPVPPPGIEGTPPHAGERRWSPATRIAFRFGFVYLGLFILATQISGSLLSNLAFPYRGLGRLWPMRDVTHWVGASVLGATALDDRSGGEPLFFWIQTFWLLAAALLAAIVWSALDRRRQHYATLYAWFLLFIRLALVSQLFEYGMTKVIPTQFPAPPLTALVTPVGELTLSALLWTSIGASPAYEIFTGCIEVLAGVLLLIPRTATLGALLAAGALTQVLVLNLTYDIGVKVVSFHLVLLAVLLLLPDRAALADFFVRHRPASATAAGAVVRTARGRRRLLAAQLVFGAYLLGTLTYINWSFWHVAGGGRPRSPLYGIWTVERLAVDGQARPPQLNDYDRRWRRVIFDAPDAVVFQRTDDSFARYGASIDADRKVIDLTKGSSRMWSARFAFERPSPDRLTVQGEMDGHRIEAQLQRVDFDAFPLLNSSFRWIRPHDP